MISRVIAYFLLVLMATAVSASDFKPLKGQTAVKVCSDAYNLPFSNKKLEGFDNKIAALIGEELGIPVEYYWFPQRIGFARNTINKVDPTTGLFLCDVAMSVPAGPGRYLTTKPYFKSIDTMIYRTGEGFELNKVSDIAALRDQGKKLTIGIFDRAIVTELLLANDLPDQIRYYQFMAGDARVYPGRLVEDALAEGTIDVAFLWGPIASYYADRSEVPMKVVPLNELGERFIFSFAMGTRKQDEAWRDLLDDIMEKRKDDIAAIITEYNLPSLENVVGFEPKEMTAKDND
ncbi:MAG: MxaJ protein [Methylophaga sp.]|nr:MAG: MxaJ protein [Methylophaga sp.]